MVSKRELRCPACGYLMVSDEELGKVIELGMKGYELLELIKLMRKSYELRKQFVREGRRVKELLNKMEGLGWNVLRKDVEKKQS